MARSSRSNFRTVSHRRRVSWAAGPRGSLLAKAGSQVAIFPTGAQAVSDDLTIVRTRGDFLISLSAASAIDEGFSWYLGMAVVTENAFNVGLTAVPAPFDDMLWDGWFQFEQGSVYARDNTPLADGSETVSQRVVIDSKAMRKMHASDVIVSVLQLIEVGTAVVSAYLETRTLFKLP